MLLVFPHHRHRPSLLVALLALLGATTQGFQQDLEYQYRYEGWAGTGITELNSERAVSAIRADLFIQILDRNESRWQIKDVEFGEQNGYTGFINSDSHDCLEGLQWQPLIDSKEAMETPFLVMWEAIPKSKVILAAQNEPAWITNIRRSLLHIFRLPVFEVQNEMVETAESIFQKEPIIQQFEQSPQGECLTWYSVMPIMDAHKMELDDDILGNIEGDIQLDSAQVADLTSKGGSKGRKGSKTSGRKGSKGAKGAKGAKGGRGTKTTPEKLVQGVPTLDDSMWRVTRTIDFEQCKDLAQYHTVGTPPTGSADHEDCHDPESLQRSHNGEFFLRGGPDGIRLERALVKGVYTVDAVGNEAEHLHTFTFQELNLRSIRNIEEEMNTEEQVYMPVDLRYFAANPMQHIFTEKTDTYIAVFKDYVIKVLKRLGQDLVTARQLNVVDELEMMSQSQILRHLMKKEDFQEIFDVFREDDSPVKGMAISLFFKVLAASGTYNPIMFIIEGMDNRDFYPEFEDGYGVAYLILNFNAIEDTRLLPHIWNFTKGWSQIPFSLLARRLCMNPCNQENTGDSNCLHDSCRPFIQNTFLPEMVNHLKRPSSEQDKHRIIQALKNLHTAESIEILKPIVLGSSEKNVLTRMHAIFALKGDNLPRASREEVFNLLNGVFENHHEDPGVREAALRMLPHWSPPASWWYHIAVSSWQEPNKQIASIICHIITTFASVNDAANRVVSITKPAPPSSLFYSQILRKKNGGKNDMIRSELLWTLMSSPASILPVLQVFKLQGGFMNFNFNDFQLTTMNADKALWKILHSVIGGSLGEKDPSADIVKEMYNEVLENLGQPLDNDEEKVELLYILLNLFKTEFMIPDAIMMGLSRIDFSDINERIVTTILLSQIAVADNKNMFINTGRYTHTVFTEIGVPLTVQHSETTFLSMLSPIEEDHQTSSARMKIIFRMDRQENVRMLTTMPWSEHELVTGLKSHQELTFPFDLIAELDQPQGMKPDLNPLTFSINNKDNTGNLLSISNTPFIAVAPIMHSSPYLSIDNYRVIRQNKGYKENHDLLEHTGLTLTSAFEGDIPYFFRRNSWHRLIASLFNGDGTPLMQPTARFYEWTFGINLPKTKVESFSFTVNYYGAELKEKEEFGDYEQMGQGKVDYSEYEQFSQQSGMDYDFGQVSQNIGQDYGDGQTTSSKVIGINQEQFDQIHKNFKFPEASKIHSVAFGIEFHEVSTQRYETIFSWATSKPDDPGSSKFQIFLSKRPYEQEPAKTTCLNINTRYPNIKQFATLEDIRDLSQISINAEAFQNPSCEPTNPFMSFEGIFKIDRNELEAMFEGPEACRPDVNDPAKLEIPSFSDATMNINFDEVPVQIQELSNQVMDVSLWGAFFPYITAYRTDVDNTKADPIVDIHVKVSGDFKTSSYKIGCRDHINANGPCFSFDACFKIENEPDLRLPLRMKYTIEEILYKDSPIHRVRFENENNNVSGGVNRETIIYSGDLGSFQCNRVLVYIKKGLDDLRDLHFKVAYEILGRNQPETVRYFVAKFCDDDECQSDTQQPPPTDQRQGDGYKVSVLRQGDGYKVISWHPGFEVVLENLNLPMDLFTPGFSLATLYNQLVVGMDSNPQCILEETKLRTFDGVTYNHELSNCWSVLARDCFQEQGLILARNAGEGFEARLLWNAAGIMVDMNRYMVMVNGEEVSNDASTHLYQVKYSEEEESMLVQFANIFSIKISDRIMLSMSPMEKGHLCGMCGDMNGEVIGEMKGPNDCIFDDGNVFVNSWSVPGDGCNAFSLRSKQKAVNNYRENCPYNKYYETGEIITVALGSPVAPPKSCYNYTYTAQRKGGYDCTSMQSVNYCQPGCTPLYEENLPIMYECALSPGNQQSSPALASFPKAGCRYYAEFPTILHRGCFPSEKCREGTSWPHEDGCNTCTCGSNGAIACTMMYCGEVSVGAQ